ncbi:MAG TPA: hypothetical protein VHF24_01100 [Acidimicrobiales bacterium]|nr:hypothetical protein [Acidimicrobiales bacterium]
MQSELGTGHGWFEHLSERDRDFLGPLARRAGVAESAVRRDPAALAHVLTHPATFDAMFGRPDDDTLVATSPFLTFAVIVHRGWSELRSARHVDEWIGVRQRLPLLSAGDLRDFLAAPHRRLFLTELLASYTRVASGATWVATRRGWRRRRFNELDPVRLASLLEVVPDEQRPGVYRRLGDLALLLTGVFPDHTERHGLGLLERGRLARMSGLDVDEREGPLLGSAPTGAVGLLEQLGPRWYRLASGARRWPSAGAAGTTSVVVEVADRFSVARRTLNHLTDRYLFTRRASWFGEPRA